MDWLDWSHYRCVSYALHTGNCIEVMRALPAESVDAVVTDPPYGLKFMGKKFDDLGEGAQQREWHRLWAVEALRVLKPGGHLLAMGGSRTYHHLASGIEDAGFEIRDRILYITGAGEVVETIGPELAWLYGSGFPKSHDVGKAIDKAAGAKRKVIGERKQRDSQKGSVRFNMCGADVETITSAATPEAQRWDGWGTALKPAHEPICVARKPLAGTVAANVLAHGVGAINIDGCRVGSEVVTTTNGKGFAGSFEGGRNNNGGNVREGRWPANVILDEDAAAALDEQSGERKGMQRGTLRRGATTGASFGGDGIYGTAAPQEVVAGYGDTGGASRFFYVAKASRKERDAGLDDWRYGKPAYADYRANTAATKGGETPYAGSGRADTKRRNIHPTVKPIALMRYLCRLVAAPGAVILDPFLGSGTTGCAVAVENNDLERAPGWSFIGIDEDAEYMKIARVRIAHWAAEGAASTDAVSDQLSGKAPNAVEENRKLQDLKNLQK
jgi:site-specific DNA-methyltransferase (adenine-specific)